MSLIDKEREPLIKVTASMKDLDDYFDVLKNDLSLYVPVIRIPGEKPALFFAETDNSSGECRVFLEKSLCEDWCYNAASRYKILPLALQAKVLLEMIPGVAKKQRLEFQSCDIRCFTRIKGDYVLIDEIYSNKQLAN